MSHASPCPSFPRPAPGPAPGPGVPPTAVQGAGPPGARGSGTPLPLHSTSPPHLHVVCLSFVPFHLISCFSPFLHCPLGVAEVGVSDVPLFLRPLPIPVLSVCPSASHP